mmetsp:Transcript_36678/g.92713  ORF Transcript_36678/g.92713 Transcript_36678/m.92713 type:complete len:235 (+) Transcript_36678:430-1134(+)
MLALPAPLQCHERGKELRHPVWMLRDCGGHRQRCDGGAALLRVPEPQGRRPGAPQRAQLRLCGQLASRGLDRRGAALCVHRCGPPSPPPALHGGHRRGAVPRGGAAGGEHDELHGDHAHLPQHAGGSAAPPPPQRGALQPHPRMLQPLLRRGVPHRGRPRQPQRQRVLPAAQPGGGHGAQHRAAGAGGVLPHAQLHLAGRPARARHVVPRRAAPVHAHRGDAGGAAEGAGMRWR